MDDDGPRIGGDREFDAGERSVALSPLDADDAGDAGGRRLGRRGLAAALALGALVVALGYDYWVVDVYLVPALRWDPTRADWLFGFSSVVLAHLLGAVAGDRALARRYWLRLRAHRGAVGGLAFLAGLFAVGLVGPAVVGRPRAELLYGLQPPAWGSVPESAVVECGGRVADGRCHGSLRYPLGTDRYGHGVAAMLVGGARVAVYLIVATTALVVPIGTAVGAVAGYYGGTVDSLLTGYVDVQSTVPAVVVYVVSVVVVGKSLFLLLLVFGLFSWGGVARIVRAATRQRRSAAYVLAGRSVGGSDRYLLRRHLLPNVSHAVVTALAGQVPLLLVTEAAVAYLGLGSADAVSWGTAIANGIETGVFTNWWIAALPAAALAGTVLVLRLLGDALRDVLDPTG